MEQTEINAAFDAVGAVRGGHFVYAKGGHGDVYVDKARLFPHVRVTSRLCRELALRAWVRSQAGAWTDRGPERIEVVVAPALGGIVLTQWIPHHLGEITHSEPPLAVFAEKKGDGFSLERGYADLVRDRNVLVAEDILNTGGSAKQIVDLVRETGGRVLGVAALVNRGGVTAEMLGAPFVVSLMGVTLPNWSAEECPLCMMEMVIDESVGHGKAFVESQKKVRR